jgi:hypothetical protein
MAEQKKKPQKKVRKNTTEPHPLYSGNYEQHRKDSKWRRSVPKARAN